MVKSRGGVKNKKNPPIGIDEDATKPTSTAVDAMDVSGTGTDLTGGDLNSTTSSVRKFNQNLFSRKISFYFRIWRYQYQCRSS